MPDSIPPVLGICGLKSSRDDGLYPRNTMRRPTERDPLLIKHQKVDASRPGPLDIQPSTRRKILVGIWLAQFLSALNLTLVPTMLPAISSDFNKSNQASWLGTSYLLATCTFTSLYGRLSNIMGRKGASQSAIFFATIGILSCGLSDRMEMLIASRFFSGIGGGGIFTVSAIITSDMYGMRSRGFVQSLGGIFYGLGMGLGGPIGGLITDSLGWRWAFLAQVPLFLASSALIAYNLCYITPGGGTNTKDILKRIDYGGSFGLLGMVGSILFLLSLRFNENREWSDPAVITSLILALSFTVLFLIVEFYIAPEPVLPPFLLTHTVPVLVGTSNALVAVCNLSVTYFFPMFFQIVRLESASSAGLHLLPNSVCISTGSIFAGWMMRKNGNYKTLNMIFGCLPFFAAILLATMKEDSHWAHLWLSIMPLGFGNAVVLQTMYIALVANLPEAHMAVGTGFAQLVRGLGQVGGLAVASALFQFRLDVELRKRISGPDTDSIINSIRQSSRLVATLPPELQQLARESYGASLTAVFTFAACASLLAYLVRLPIPDKQLEDRQPNTASIAEPSTVASPDEDDEGKSMTDTTRR